MLGRHLVRPLESDWRDVLDGVARARGWPTTHEPAKLGARVRELSEAYNDATRARASTRDAGAARLGFSFARDVPKGAAAVRELVATGWLRRSAETLRVLDVGAGLGATTWGVARALDAAGVGGEIDATFVDPDAAALDLARALAAARPAAGAMALRVRAVARPAGPLDDLPRHDLVLAGQLLSELDVGEPEEARVDRHAKLLYRWLEDRLEPQGSLVVVEPALRDRTRHLHRVRDALVAMGATVFAPCLHAAPCPALTHEGDWCHEDLDVDLPDWLVPVARAAGLRREGLTFSYLVLRRDGNRVGSAMHAPPGAARLRVVSQAIPSKGKLEAFVCGELAGSGGALLAGRVKAARLDRDASTLNAAWDEVSRGDLLVVTPAPEEQKARVGVSSQVVRCGESESL
ncbi:MAG TPA: small ribosomal subunit Rsm22 family protein [Polyangiaceae bacterium]